MGRLFSLGIIALVIGACSTNGIKTTILSTSGNKPEWVDTSRIIWEEDNKIFIKSHHTLGQNTRPNACITLAKLDAKEDLITGIQDEVKGLIDETSQSISMDAEQLLSKSRSSQFSAKVRGLRFTETWHKRSMIGEREQLDCYALSEITKSDYNKLRRLVLFKVEEVDPKIKSALTAKHQQFFEREPSSNNE